MIARRILGAIFMLFILPATFIWGGCRAVKWEGIPEFFDLWRFVRYGNAEGKQEESK